MRNLRPHPRGHQAGGCELKEAIMITGHSPSKRAVTQVATTHGLSRRDFLQAAAAAGGRLLVSLALPLRRSEAGEAAGDAFAPNAFVKIQTDGQIVLTMPYVEMGQGTYTAIPMLIAEELEVDLDQ